MAYERFWPAMGPVSLTSAATSRGLVTLSSTAGFRVKMQVLLQDTVLGPQRLEVKRVISDKKLYLGPVAGKITDRTDLTGYTTTSSLTVMEQSRPSIPKDERDRAMFEEEPVLAQRSLIVDQYGAPVTGSNPLTTQFNETVIDYLDTPLLNAATTSIPASADPHLQVVASLAKAAHKIFCHNETTAFIGVYRNASRELMCIIYPGVERIIPVQLNQADAIYFRSMENIAATKGRVMVQFIGLGDR
jgi:hypothetical protein